MITVCVVISVPLLGIEFNYTVMHVINHEFFEACHNSAIRGTIYCAVSALLAPWLWVLLMYCRRSIASYATRVK